jgi:hypothetical protein
MLLAAMGLMHLNKTVRSLVAGVLILTAAVALHHIYTSPGSTFIPENTRDLAKYVHEQERPGDAVIVAAGINGCHIWRYYNPNADNVVYANPYWSEHFFGIRPPMVPDEFLQPPAFHAMVDPYLEKHDRVWLVMMGGRHQIIATLSERLKKEYDYTLHYNKEENALAEIKRLPPADPMTRQ